MNTRLNVDRTRRRAARRSAAAKGKTTQSKRFAEISLLKCECMAMLGTMHSAGRRHERLCTCVWYMLITAAVWLTAGYNAASSLQCACTAPRTCTWSSLELFGTYASIPSDSVHAAAAAAAAHLLAAEQSSCLCAGSRQCDGRQRRASWR